MASTKQSGPGLVMGAFLGYGVVRLFKSPATAVAEDPEDKELYVQPREVTTDKSIDNETEPSTILCVLAVPSYMTPYDLMQYFDDGFADSITHYRLVRSGSVPTLPLSESNQPLPLNYNNISNMVLIKFRDVAAAAQFYAHFNGRTFNSLEPETCHVVYVRHVRNKTVRSIPALPDDPFVEGHCFAMDVESQRVWDYGADGYVHRLMQNQEDGKLVEIPSPMPPPIREPGTAVGTTGALSNSGEYINAGAFGTSGFPKVSIAGSSGTKPKKDVGEQFAQLLTSQLDSQREYYEALLSTAVERISLLNSTEQKLQDTVQEQEQLKQAQAELERELEKARAKTARLQENYEKALHRYIEERAINERTVEKTRRLETQLTQGEAELADLREQVRDLMFFHEAQEQFKDVADDVKEGQVIVGSKPSSSSKKKKTRKKKNEVVITTK